MRMRHLATALQWCLLLAGSSALAFSLEPWLSTAGVLVAAMVTAVCFGLSGAQLRVPPSFVRLAQATTAVAIASTVDTRGLVKAATNGWVLVAVLLTIAIPVVVGWMIVRFGSLPGTTGAWGSLPGAASVMGPLGMDNGADGILVSLMQYLRVVLVVATGPIIVHALEDAGPAVIATSASNHSSEPYMASGVVLALAVSLLGCWIGSRFRILAGAFLVPLLLGTLCTVTFSRALHVPAPLLAGCFTILGWAIGLQFRRELAISMIQSLPEMLLAIFAMLTLCGFCAWLLSNIASISFLTAYLATTPGGIDSVVAVAMGTSADLNFVVAAQTLRLFTVVSIGPLLVKTIARSK